jgi:iron complex outermembrane receptor protein
MNPASPSRLFFLNCIAVSAGALLVCAANAQQTPPSSTSENDEVVHLSEFVVSESSDQGYRASNTIAGTRLNQKLENVAQNISIITEDFIKDLAATELYEALEYTTGVTRDSPTNESSFTVRGFNALRPLRNGVTTSGELLTDTATIQRVEVVKGPSAVLYGVSSPGGVINYITKEPEHKQAYVKADMTFGSYNRFRGQLDYNQPLGKRGPFAIRLMAAYDRDTGYIGDGRRRVVLAPSLSWRISSTTQLYINYERIKQDMNRQGPGVLNYENTGFLNLPRELNTRGPDTRDSDVSFLNAQFRSKLSDHWSLKISGNFHSNPQEFETFDISGVKAARDAAGDYLNIYMTRRKTKYPNYQGQAEAVARYKFWGIESTTLIGTEYLYNRFSQWYRGSAATENLKWYINDPSTWTYGNFHDSSIYTTSANSTNNMNRHQDFWGVYLDQQLAFFRDRLRLSAGLRVDDFRLRYDYPAETNRAPALLQADARSPKFGAVLVIVPGVNLYGLVSRSFEPNTQVDENGDPIKPRIGKGLEGGVKLNLFGGRLSMTGSVYEIKRQNVAQVIPGTSPAVYRAIGEETVNGAECQIFYSPTTEWDIIASYSYNDGSVTADANPANIGNPMAAVSRETVSFWNKYTFKKGALKNLRFGAGCTYRGVQLAYPTTTSFVEVPGYTLVDAFVGYSFKAGKTPVYLNLKANNVFDKYYRRTYGVIGMPTNYSLSIGTKF